MRVESAITSVTWRPFAALDALAGLPLGLAVAHHDEPPGEPIAELAVPLASSQFDEAGRLTDDELRARLAEVAAQVVAENAVTVAA
jgi:hypothetical protein